MEMGLSHRWSDDRTLLVKKREQKYREKVKKVAEVKPINNFTLMLDDYIAKVAFFMLFYFNRFTIQIANADSMSGLNDIFNTEAFVGNTKWLEKFNWVGELVQMCITVFGLLIAVILFGQILVTLIYFAARPFWDAVDNVKQAETGLLNYTYSTFSNIKGNVSRGSDIVMNYLMLLMPNVKKYSEMGSDSADQNWTFSTWLISTFPAKCFLILIVSMTINGTLMQAYMMVVDGMGVVAQRFVDFNSEDFVNKVFNNMTEGYKFAVGSTGIGYDKAQGEIANSIYREAIKKLKDNTTDAKVTLGSNIERYVTQELSKELIESKVMPKLDSSLTEDEWAKLKIETVCNNTPTATNAISVTGSSIGLNSAGDKQLYVHIYFTLSSRSNSTNYWELIKDE